MVNWFEIEVEKGIAQERYSRIIQPGLKELKSTDSSTPRLFQLLAWTGRQLSGLGCTLQHFAGEPCV